MQKAQYLSSLCRGFILKAREDIQCTRKVHIFFSLITTPYIDLCQILFFLELCQINFKYIPMSSTLNPNIVFPLAFHFISLCHYITSYLICFLVTTKYIK